jgi:hypothetical protein
MNALKLTLTASLVAAAALVSVIAAEGHSTPPAGTPAPQEMAGSCHVKSHAKGSDKASGPVVGSPRELSNRPAVLLSDAKGCCATMKKGAPTSCCK